MPVAAMNGHAAQAEGSSRCGMQWREPWEFGKPPEYAPIAPPPHPTFDLDQAIHNALEEDAGGVGDLTSLATVPAQQQATGTFLAKAEGVLAGLAVATRVFQLVSAELELAWTGRDGQHVTKGTRFGTVRGPAGPLLTAERVALNFLQRMSGVATATARMQAEVQGTGAKVIETRKTVPGLRVLDKWGVLAGGGANHRIGLFDMVMIKDNHVTAAGGITAAVQRTTDYLAARNLSVPVEVETRTLDEVDEVLRLLSAPHPPRIDRLMLDNMAQPERGGCLDTSMLQKAVRRIGSAVETEASGNVTLETVRQIAQTGVTFISSGALTHSVAALDVSLKIQLS